MKKKVGIVCGGYSGEDVISMKSAAMIQNNIDKDRFDPRLIIISKGGWKAQTSDGEVEIDKNDFSFVDSGTKFTPDLCFIIIHGTPGEDGKLQGYFDLIGMPYTSGDVVNTSVTFNKIMTTKLLGAMDFKVAEGILLGHPSELDEDKVERELAFPVFVKPNEGGSSLGITKVNDKNGLKAAAELAYSTGATILIEEFLEGREFSCGAIQTETGCKTLEITEITTEKEFFDFAAKYDYDQTQEITPADLPADLYAKCQLTTEQIFTAFNCRGWIRVDYILRGNEFYAIEINTVPGMSEKSIVPQQAEEMGIDKTTLISMIIDATCPA